MDVRETKLEPGDIERMLRKMGLEIQMDQSTGGVVFEKCSKCGRPYHRRTYT